MKNLLWACLYALLLTGCIGGNWPEPGTPHTEKPEDPKWLLTKVTTRVLLAIGPGHITKTVDEYQYNEHHKPVVHRNYHNAGDSNDLKLMAVDSLFYDDQHRVVQVNNFKVQLNLTPTLRKFMYRMNDRMPYRSEHHSIFDPSGSVHPYPVLLYNQEYTYQDTLVVEVENGDDLYNDTSMHHYTATGNYTFSEGPPGRPGPAIRQHEFRHYDNFPNPQLYFNLEHGLALRIDDKISVLMVYLPVISKNNWTTYLSRQELNVVRKIVVNEDGLVVETNSPFGDYGDGYFINENIVYEYTKVK